MLSDKLTKMIHEQIVHELYSSNAYLAIASFFSDKGLSVLAAKFFEQSAEERDHALRFMNYLLDVGADVQIGAIPEPQNTFKSAEDAVAKSLKQEEWVTELINNLMAQAHEDKDFATISFLKWFIDEQVEEMSSMSELLQLVRMAGEDNILMVEHRLMRMGVEPHSPGESE